MDSIMDFLSDIAQKIVDFIYKLISLDFSSDEEELRKR